MMLAEPTASSRSSSGPTLVGRTILVIDDNAEGVLQSLQARVLTAESLQETNRQIGLRRPDLIVCDMHLPDGTGLDFIKRPIPSIAITGYAEIFPARLAEGFDAYMRKPIDLERLCTVPVALTQR